jgi:site-specific DNA-methyltransferase (adenine-specific)
VKNKLKNMKKQFKLMLGDNMLNLKKLPDNSIDSIVSDPPYGLSFMNKKWDYDVPTVEFWREVYRVLKPGGHILSFGGTRTYHRMVVNIEDAGFEIRDQVMWLYGSGFPKSHNIGKAVDKLQGNDREVVGERSGAMNNSETSEAASFVKDGVGFKTHFTETKGQSKYEGWGTALKPANEPICVARKPLSEKSVAENVLKWGTGGINIDGCRVGSETISVHNAPKGTFAGGDEDRGSDTNSYREHEGRFPANIILECCCDEVIKGEKGEIVYSERKADGSFGNASNKLRNNFTDTGDIHSNPNCPCYLLNEQSGVSKSSKSNKVYENDASGRVVANSAGGQRSPESTYGDKGGASRFFYVAKVSKKERNLGLDGFEAKIIEGRDEGQDATSVAYKKRPTPTKNNHPTLKPINLMTYLCRLITPEGGIVLDPFMGSGSTGIAACLEGFRFVGMEMDEDYFKIATARIESFEEYRTLLK